MSLSGERMLDALEALRNGRQATTVVCTRSEAKELKDFLYENGLNTEVTRKGDLQYRFRKTEEAGHAPR